MMMTEPEDLDASTRSRTQNSEAKKSPSLALVSSQISSVILPAELEIARINRRILESLRQRSDASGQKVPEGLEKDVEPDHTEICHDAESAIGEKTLDLGATESISRILISSPARSAFFHNSPQFLQESFIAEAWVNLQLENIGAPFLPRENVEELLRLANDRFDAADLNESKFPAQKGPLSDAGLDRKTLYRLHMPKDVVDRLYRALYVYTSGFQTMMREIVKHIPLTVAPRLMSNIWLIVYALLEQCDHGKRESIFAVLKNSYKKWKSEQEAQFDSEKLKTELKMQEALGDLSDVKQYANSQKEQAEGRKQDLLKSEAVVQKLQKIVAVYKEEVQDLTQNIRDLEKGNGQLKKELDDSKHEYEIAHAERLYALTEKFGIEEENAKLRTHLDRQNIEMQALMQRVRESLTLNESLRIELDAIKQKNLVVVREVEELKQEKQKVEEQLTTTKANLLNQIEKKQQLKSQVYVWQHKHQRAEVCLEALSEQYQSEVIHNASHVEKISELMTQLNDGKVQIGVLETKCDLLVQEKEHGGMRPQDKIQFDNLLNQKMQIEAEKEQLISDHMQDEEMIMHLQEKTKASTLELKHLKEMFLASQQACIGLERKSERLRQELVSIEKKREEADKRIGTLKAHLSTAETHSREQERKLLITASQLQDCEDKSREDAATLAELMESVNTLNEKLCDMEADKPEQLLADNRKPLSVETCVEIPKVQVRSFLNALQTLLKSVKEDEVPADEALREAISLVPYTFKDVFEADKVLAEEDELIEFEEEEEEEGVMPLPEEEKVIEVEVKSVAFEIEPKHIDAPQIEERTSVPAMSKGAGNKANAIMERCVFFMSQHRKSRLEMQLKNLLEEILDKKQLLMSRDAKIETLEKELQRLAEDYEKLLQSAAQYKADTESTLASSNLIETELIDERAQRVLAVNTMERLKSDLEAASSVISKSEIVNERFRKVVDRQIAFLEDSVGHYLQETNQRAILRSLRRDIGIQALVQITSTHSQTQVATRSTADQMLVKKVALKSAISPQRKFTKISCMRDDSTTAQAYRHMQEATSLLLPYVWPDTKLATIPDCWRPSVLAPRRQDIDRKGRGPSPRQQISKHVISLEMPKLPSEIKSSTFSMDPLSPPMRNCSTSNHRGHREYINAGLDILQSMDFDLPQKTKSDRYSDPHPDYRYESIQDKLSQESSYATLNVKTEDIRPTEEIHYDM